MGDWNETCALSHLPIQEGAQITAVILMCRANNFHECRAYTNYSPVCLPVDCEYDGYGRVTKSEKLKYTDELLRYYCENGTISYANFEAYSYVSFERLVKDIQDEGLYFNCSGVKHKLEVAYYLSGLYEKICKDYGTRESFEGHISNAEKYLQESSTLVETSKKYQELKNKLKESESFYDAVNFYDLSGKLSDDFFRVCRVSESDIFLKDYLAIITGDEISDFFRELMDFVLFVNALNSGRYSFKSTSGSGSQSADYFVQWLVAEYVLNFKLFDDDF